MGIVFTYFRGRKFPRFFRLRLTWWSQRFFLNFWCRVHDNSRKPIILFRSITSSNTSLFIGPTYWIVRWVFCAFLLWFCRLQIFACLCIFSRKAQNFRSLRLDEHLSFSSKGRHLFVSLFVWWLSDLSLIMQRWRWIKGFRYYNQHSTPYHPCQSSCEFSRQCPGRNDDLETQERGLQGVKIQDKTRGSVVRNPTRGFRYRRSSFRKLVTIYPRPRLIG